jgi:hypothetical protein
MVVMRNQFGRDQGRNGFTLAIPDADDDSDASRQPLRVEFVSPPQWDAKEEPRSRGICQRRRC